MEYPREPTEASLIWLLTLHASLRNVFVTGRIGYFLGGKRSHRGGIGGMRRNVDQDFLVTGKSFIEREVKNADK